MLEGHEHTVQSGDRPEGGPAHVPLVRERESWAGSSQPGSPVCFRMGCPAREVYRVGTLFEQVFDFTLSSTGPATGIYHCPRCVRCKHDAFSGRHADGHALTNEGGVWGGRHADTRGTHA
jgi:hypothetical protein